MVILRNFGAKWYTQCLCADNQFRHCVHNGLDKQKDEFSSYLLVLGVYMYIFMYWDLVG